MATATRELLEEHDVHVVEWPPKGADLSPIEACFGEMQRQAKLHYSEITTPSELWDFVSDLVFENKFDEFV
jgi:transposase